MMMMVVVVIRLMIMISSRKLDQETATKNPERILLYGKIVSRWVKPVGMK